MIIRVRELDPYLWEPNINISLYFFPFTMAISLRADRLNHFRHHLSVVSEFRVLGIIELDPYLCVWIDIIFALHFYPSLY